MNALFTCSRRDNKLLNFLGEASVLKQFDTLMLLVALNLFRKVSSKGLRH